MTTDERNAMVEANVGLVPTIAARWVGLGLDVEDLVAEGNLGLIKAVERFDP